MDGPVVAASLPTAPDDGRHYVEAGLLTDLLVVTKMHESWN